MSDIVQISATPLSNERAYLSEKEIYRAYVEERERVTYESFMALVDALERDAESIPVFLAQKQLLDAHLANYIAVCFENWTVSRSARLTLPEQIPIPGIRGKTKAGKNSYVKNVVFVPAMLCALEITEIDIPRAAKLVAMHENCIVYFIINIREQSVHVTWYAGKVEPDFEDQKLNSYISSLPRFNCEYDEFYGRHLDFLNYGKGRNTFKVER